MEEKLEIRDTKQVRWEYDDKADVLYISFGKPKPSISTDLGSGIILRHSEGKVTGFTIVGLREVLLSRKFGRLEKIS